MSEYLAKVNILHDKLERLTRDIMSIEASLEYIHATTGDEQSYMSRLTAGLIYTLLQQTKRISEDSIKAEMIAVELAK